jgi:hypothetical protein
MNKTKQIYFHVGLGKTGTTYLQYKFFPKIKDVFYIQRTKYRRAVKIINKTNYGKYLVSREFDRQLEDEVQYFSKHFPDAKPIMVLRRQDGWIASQFRRYAKNGGHLPFEKFIDLENNTGLWKKDELLFYPKIQILEKYFSSKPLVLLHEELVRQPYTFFDKIVRFMGASYDKDQVSLTRQHKSYNEKQLLILREINKVLHLRPRKIHNKPLSKIEFRSRWLVLHLLLYIAYILPGFLVKNKRLINKKSLEKIRDFYADDWNACKDYAQ